MAKNPISNPLLPPLQEALDKKRHRGTGLVHRSWLLVLLTILDHVQKAGAELSEDDIYTYDYTLQGSRGATARLVAKHSFPDLGMKKEGVTTRGAPGLRFFKAVQGGAILKELDNGLQERFLKEAIDLLRTEARKVEEQPYLELPYSAFENAGTFLRALLDAAKKRSQGRVEQAVVEAKLQLRFPDEVIPNLSTFAADRQTGRVADFHIGNNRIIVSAAPKDQHLASARRLADAGHTVYLVVGERAVARAKVKVKRDNVIVSSVREYVAGNIGEVSSDRKLPNRTICLLLAEEYNRRIAAVKDRSLQLVVPSDE